MIRAGASPKTVQTVMGHSSAAFTLDVYGHIFEDDLDDLAENLEQNAYWPRTEKVRPLRPASSAENL